MNDPKPCPECGAYQGHSPRCSLIDFEEAKVQLSRYFGYFLNFEVRLREVANRLDKEVTNWQGRHAILRQENNALRRKLYPQKKICRTKPTS